MKYKKFLKLLKICPFCNLEKDEIIKENNSARLILAKAPYQKDHLLVVPKKHVLTFNELNRKELSDVFGLVIFAQKILNKNYKNLSILYREGDKKKIGKSIDHFHFNLIPNEQIGSISINKKNRNVLSEKEYLIRTKEIRRKIK